MAKKITTREAFIQTATVEVKTIVIGNRQVTLSVFRQLIESPIIDIATVKLNGTPWGRVHYFPDKWCAERSASHGHIHVVWQSGAELRRSCVEELAQHETFRELSHDLDRKFRRYAHLSRISFVLAAAENPSDLSFVPAGGRSANSAWIDYSGGEFRIGGRSWRIPDGHPGADTLAGSLVTIHEVRLGRKPWCLGEASGDIASAARNARLQAQAANDGRPISYSESLAMQDAAAMEYRQLKESLARSEAAYQEIYGQLCSLPQLFIAV